MNDVLYSCVQHDDEPRREVILKQEDDLCNYIKRENDYEYRVRVKFIVEKRISEYTYARIHYNVKLGQDELDKLADDAADMMKKTVNNSAKELNERADELRRRGW